MFKERTEDHIPSQKGSSARGDILLVDLENDIGCVPVSLRVVDCDL